MRGVISSTFEKIYTPELLKDAAARRVEGVLAGYALEAQPPPIATPLDPLREHDPVLLAVYGFMVGHHEEKQGEPFKGFMRELMTGSRAAALKLSVSLDEAFNDVQVFGTRVRVLIPDFLRLNLKFVFKHRHKGSWVEVSWTEAPNDPDDGEAGDQTSSTPSPDKPQPVKPLRRRDGRDVGELISRIAVQSPEDENPHS